MGELGRLDSKEVRRVHCQVRDANRCTSFECRESWVAWPGQTCVMPMVPFVVPPFYQVLESSRMLDRHRAPLEDAIGDLRASVRSSDLMRLAVCLRTETARPKPFCGETFGVEDLIMGSWQDETRNSGDETCCTAITQ